jgi:hypothetical protein
MGGGRRGDPSSRPLGEQRLPARGNPGGVEFEDAALGEVGQADFDFGSEVIEIWFGGTGGRCHCVPHGKIGGWWYGVVAGWPTATPNLKSIRIFLTITKGRAPG